MLCIVAFVSLLFAIQDCGAAPRWRSLETKRGRELFGKRSYFVIMDQPELFDDSELIDIDKRRSRELFGKRSMPLTVVSYNDFENDAFPREIRKGRELFGKRSGNSWGLVKDEYDDFGPIKRGRVRELLGKRGRELFGKRSTIPPLATQAMPSGGSEVINASICSNVDDCRPAEDDDVIYDEQVRRLVDALKQDQQQQRRQRRGRGGELLGR